MAEQATAPMSVADFLQKVNTAYKGTILRQGGTPTASLNMARFSSGILTTDCALGGGWPFARIAIIAGEESTGKTLLALKAAHSIQSYDRKTRLHKSRMTAVQSFEPCRVLFVDVEHAFDEAWATANGWNPLHNVLAQPEYAEQASDIVTDAIRENVFDLIVVDSIAALTPMKEVEASSEEWQMGLGARLTNKAMRRWVSALASSYAHHGQAPAVICLNQFRLQLGIQFGDPRVLPNGKGQRFAAAILVYTRGAKVVDDEEKEHGWGQYGGVTYKNKTFIPKCNFQFRMALKDHKDAPKGTVDNLKQLVVLGKQFQLIRKDGAKWRVGAQEFTTLTEIEGRLQGDENFRLLMWRSVVSAFGGTVV